MIPADKKNKERKTDRVINFAPIDEKLVKNGSGTLDPRLFQGTNKLHIIKNPSNNLWYFKYENGVLQETLKGTFTTFDKAFNHARQYFKKRGIEIESVLD